mgnify:CR=1 FL=1
MNENGYFEEALHNFVRNFAYGDAIRHLVDRGYSVDKIMRSGQVHLPREQVEKIVNDYLQKRGKNF